MSFEEWIEQLGNLVKAFDDPFGPDETIYHYTSAEGFRGIVASGEIWLTNTAFVNDTTECKAFWDLPKEKVLGTEAFPNRHVEDRWEQMETHQRTDEYYVASFSRTRDSLQQFRGYGSYCVGFDASRLVRTGFYLYKCVYDAQAIQDWIRQRSCIEQWESDHIEDVAKMAAASNLLLAASMKYKNEHYEAEREVRMISISKYDLRDANIVACEGQPSIHFRDHRTYGLPFPYVKFFLAPGQARNGFRNEMPTETAGQMKRRRLKEEDRLERDLLPITDVSIGPMARKEDAKLACEIMLQEKGYGDVRVRVPDIPYRGV